jgi:hypothetical protein
MSCPFGHKIDNSGHVRRILDEGWATPTTFSRILPNLVHPLILCIAELRSH